MKKFLLLCSVFASFASAVSAQMPYMEEVKALGTVSGQGMACGSSRYTTFEMLARAIMLTKAPDLETMNEAMYAYNQAKANAYMSKQMDGFYECPLIVRRFDNQDIFNITLYADGSLKMPDGKIIKPVRPYDASLIYDSSAPEIRSAQNIYNNRKKAALSPGQTPLQITSLKPEPLPRYENAAAGKTASVPAASSAARSPSSVKHISRR